jgi:inosine-uridine nucleoside N-ribohydrolase
MQVIIDTDPGLGRRGKDVDDGLALFFILNNPEAFKVKGITTVYGNTRVNVGFKLLEKYLELKNSLNIPHFKGLSSNKELGKINPASEFMINQVKTHPNKLTLIALGPLTNVATALDYYPNFFNELKRIVFMGGVIKSTIHRFKPQFILGEGIFDTTEFNFHQDPLATKRVIEAKTDTPRIGIGLDVCTQLIFKREHLDKLEKVNSPIIEFIIPFLEKWLKIWEFNISKGFYPFDTVVPIYLMHPKMFVCNNYHLKVDTDKIPGKLIINNQKDRISTPISYCMKLKNPNFKDKFMDLLLQGLI